VAKRKRSNDSTLKTGLDGGVPLIYYRDPEWGYTHIDSTELVVDSWSERLDDIIKEMDDLKKEIQRFRKKFGNGYERS
jgi:hypothetical protein